MTARCLICGRFAGLYPQAFYCDIHCARCACKDCPEGHRLAVEWAAADALKADRR